MKDALRNCSDREYAERRATNKRLFASLDQARKPATSQQSRSSSGGIVEVARNTARRHRQPRQSDARHERPQTPVSSCGVRRSTPIGPTNPEPGTYGCFTVHIRTVGHLAPRRPRIPSGQWAGRGGRRSGLRIRGPRSRLCSAHRRSDPPSTPGATRRNGGILNRRYCR